MPRTQIDRDQRSFVLLPHRAILVLLQRARHHSPLGWIFQIYKEQLRMKLVLQLGGLAVF